ncbi:MAG: hypothetical protein QMD10_10480, partial [Desulfitobacteriaceae bacterium]|nr:hypothetical protein [Desulfitobacteriaceae bacterium]
MKSKNRTLQVIVFLTLVVLSLAYLLPIYVMITTSLKSIEEINRGSYLSLSGNPQFSNYREVLYGSPQFRSHMLPRLINSCIISFSVTFLSALIGGLGGYYLSRTRTTFTRILFVLVGIALYLPYQAVIIPLVIFMAKTKLALTYWGLIGAYLILNVPLA